MSDPQHREEGRRLLKRLIAFKLVLVFAALAFAAWFIIQL